MRGRSHIDRVGKFISGEGSKVVGVRGLFNQGEEGRKSAKDIEKERGRVK